MDDSFGDLKLLEVVVRNTLFVGFIQAAIENQFDREPAVAFPAFPILEAFCVLGFRYKCVAIEKCGWNREYSCMRTIITD